MSDVTPAPTMPPCSRVRPPRRLAGALLVVAFALAAPPRPADAQPAPSAGGSSAAAWPARIATSARGALDAVADSARAGGLPVAPLHAKAQEGVLKGADDARIVAAVRRLAAELGAARAALGPAATPSELVAGAGALHAGVQPAALRELAAARGARRDPAGGALAMLLVVAGDLVVRGVPPELATSALASLAARGAGEADLAALRREVDRDIRGGAAPHAAATARARSLTSQLDGRRAAPPE